MDSFDQALKYLAQHNPRDFIRFALGDPNVDILKPLPTALPARGRDVDACYLISSGDLGEDLLMGSEFYDSVIAKGFVQGEAQGIRKGEAKALATSIVDILQRRLGTANNNVRKRVLAETNIETLQRWKDMAFDALDAESAKRLVDDIGKPRST